MDCLSRRSFLTAAIAVPLIATASAPSALAQTSEFGDLVLEINPEVDRRQFFTGELSAKIYENGIAVTRRGLTVARKSKAAMAKLWRPSFGFPTDDISYQSNGSYYQEFTGVTTYWSGEDFLGSVTIHPSDEWETNTFKDVPESHELYRYVEILSKLGVTNGWPDGTFRPQAPVLRDAFAAFCYRINGSPAYTPPNASPFKDVARDNIFYKEICWLHAQGIANGWPDGTFRPLAPILRDAMAAMLYRMTPKSAYSFTPLAESGFRDVAKSNLFYREIEWMRATGISTGWLTDFGEYEEWYVEYKPFAKATRAETAAFLVRWFDLFGDRRLNVIS